VYAINVKKKPSFLVPNGMMNNMCIFKNLNEVLLKIQKKYFVLKSKSQNKIIIW
jgi:hypothetical protein